ncbi:hypothetical protein AB0H12_30805 [Actinosynnema sp. NPDC023794]
MAGPDAPAVYLSCVEHEFGDPVPLSTLADAEVQANLDLLTGEGLRDCRVATSPPVEMAAASVRRTLRAAQLPEPDAVVYCCDTPEPGVAPAAVAGDLAAAVGIPTTPVVAAGGGGCGNLGPGLRVARGLLFTEGCSNVVLVTADRAAGSTRYLPHDLTVLSDGAASCVVGTAPLGPAFRLLGIASTANAAAAAGGLGAAKAVVAGVARATRRVLAAAGLTPADCRYLVTGNYGAAVRSLLASAAGFPRHAVHAPGVADLAHCFAADALAGLRGLVADGAVAGGDRLVLLATSPRSWSAVLVEHEA